VGDGNRIRSEATNKGLNRAQLAFLVLLKSLYGKELISEITLAYKPTFAR